MLGLHNNKQVKQNDYFLKQKNIFLVFVILHGPSQPSLLAARPDQDLNPMFESAENAVLDNYEITHRITIVNNLGKRVKSH